jgi:hypothetical protein
MPQRHDYDLGKWGKVGAALAGFGAGYQDPAKGVAVATGLRDAPYKRALTDYDNKLKNLGEVAGFEQDDRKNRMAGLKLELEGVKDRRTADRDDLKFQSEADRRRDQTKNEIARLGLDWRKFDLDMLDKLSDNQRADLLANETVTHNRNTEETGNFNARTGRMNAGTNAFNAQTSRNTSDFHIGPEFENKKWTDLVNQGIRINEETGRNERDKTGSTSYVNPNQQRDANDAAATELYQSFPNWRNKYFIKNDKGYITLNPELSQEDMDSPEGQQVLSKYRGRARALANQRRGGGSTNTTGTGRFVPEP